MGDPQESVGARWAPTVVMAGVLIVILWAAIEGAIANGDMHDHIFATDQDSVRSEITNLFDTVIEKFEGAPNDAQYVVDNVNEVLDSVENILKSQNGP